MPTDSENPAERRPRTPGRTRRLAADAEKIATDAGRVAADAEGHLHDPEGRWPVTAAILVAVALQAAIPERYTAFPRWPVIGLELVLLAVLVKIHPMTFDRQSTVGRWGSLTLTAALTVVNIASMVVLAVRTLTGEVSNNAAALLGGGAAIYVTNVIVFGLWYWELDRGGPYVRRDVAAPYPDFLFPQMTQSGIAPADWRPLFVDYLYVSVTNSVAFSPTDTMPLTWRAKSLMTVQAAVATSTLILVVARAVNVLR